MALFGGGGGGATTVKISRPQYIQDMINRLNGQIQNTSSGEYINKQFAGTNADQQAAYEQLMASPELNQLAQQYMRSGQEGLSDFDSAYSQLQDLYNQQITPEQIDQLAGSLYSQSDVQAAIDAQNDQTKEQLARQALPQVAEQYGGQQGFGSGQRVATDMVKTGALNQMQDTANSISDQAYQSALNQANSILSGNRQSQGAALSALGSNAGYMAGLGTRSGDLEQQAIENAWNAGQQQQQQQQSQMNNDYTNAINKQNYGWQQVNNLEGAASVLNGALGQKSTSTTTGGGGGIFGGMVSGAITGFMTGGPYGALAGAAVGGASAAASE